ncbi:hypothetical protein MNBD_GAMMA09-3818 [hydrothermal vent metagenome]|uniref:Outer membrane lipoprotein n=1 Tax=hydrothermal vent metagenome TaxID=652676 RepID=A0A3B0Y6U9_9ZZZZ
MKIRIKQYLILILSIFISACSVIQKHPGNYPVRLIFDNELVHITKIRLSECKYLGTLVSSEGSWYDFIYISNANLTNGAINDMQNKANDIGANLVYIDNNIDFKTSVTLVGQAYVCEFLKY